MRRISQSWGVFETLEFPSQAELIIIVNIRLRNSGPPAQQGYMKIKWRDYCTLV